MASFGDLMGRVGLGGDIFGGGIISLGIAMLIGAVGLSVVGFIIWWFFSKRKNWNIKVEVKIPRDIKEVIEDDGTITVKGVILKEWGKGFYNAKQGTVYIKRKGKKPVPMKPFDVKQFLSGGQSILTVIQIGIEDYRPVLEESYVEVEDSESGDEAALLKTKIDISESKSWRRSFERESKSTYTIMGFLSEHGQLIGFAFILFVVIVGFAIVIGRMP